MIIKKLNRLIFLLNQAKTLNKNYFFMLKTPELLTFLKILQTERCISFFRIVKKSNNKTFLQIYLNTTGNFEVFSLASNYQQYFFKIKFLKVYLNSNIKLKVYLNTKNGVICDTEAIQQNLGGTLLFGIKYL